MSEYDNKRPPPTGEYAEKKRFFDGMITLYGRKPVLEILEDPASKVFRVHLADSNKSGGIIDEIVALCRTREVEIVYHSKQALSRISKNARQDQGVAVDLRSVQYLSLEGLKSSEKHLELLALDRITNPQNLGMIIRSVAASPLDGLLLPKKGGAKIDPLVHKASAGTLIRTPIYYCETIENGLRELADAGFKIIGVDARGSQSIKDLGGEPSTSRVFVMGNETEGLSDSVKAICHEYVSIPVNRGVESLNVAAAATLIAFHRIFS